MIPLTPGTRVQILPDPLVYRLQGHRGTVTRIEEYDVGADVVVALDEEVAGVREVVVPAWAVLVVEEGEEAA